MCKRCVQNTWRLQIESKYVDILVRHQNVSTFVFFNGMFIDFMFGCWQRVRTKTIWRIETVIAVRKWIDVSETMRWWLIHLYYRALYVTRRSDILMIGDAWYFDLQTPIGTAASAGYTEVVKLLIELGADVNLKNVCWMTFFVDCY